VTAHTVLLWAAWAVFTFGWNGVNTLNSVGKNSSSLWLNAWTTFATSCLYITSILWLGNLLLTARQALPYAIVAYGILSTSGSVTGQKLALRWKATHHELK